MNEGFVIALVLRPLVLFVLLLLIYPIKLLVEKKMPQGRLKSLLLRRIGGSR